MATCRHKGKGINRKYLIFNIINSIYFSRDKNGAHFNTPSHPRFPQNS